MRENLKLKNIKLWFHCIGTYKNLSLHIFAVYSLRHFKYQTRIRKSQFIGQVGIPILLQTWIQTVPGSNFNHVSYHLSRMVSCFSSVLTHKCLDITLKHANHITNSYQSIADDHHPQTIRYNICN